MEYLFKTKIPQTVLSKSDQPTWLVGSEIGLFVNSSGISEVRGLSRTLWEAVCTQKSTLSREICLYTTLLKYPWCTEFFMLIKMLTFSWRPTSGCLSPRSSLDHSSTEHCFEFTAFVTITDNSYLALALHIHLWGFFVIFPKLKTALLLLGSYIKCLQTNFILLHWHADLKHHDLGKVANLGQSNFFFVV